MEYSIVNRFPNSVLFVMDPSIGVIPDSMSRSIVASTDSCIAVGTNFEQEGSTNVLISDKRSKHAEFTRVFEGCIRTPNFSLAVCDIYEDVMIEFRVLNSVSKIEIWVNQQHVPTAIEIITELQEKPDS